MQAELALAVDETAYRVWLAQLRPRGLDQQRLQLEAPASACAWIHDRFGRVLESCAASVIAPGTVVEVLAPESPADPASSTTHESSPSSAAANRRQQRSHGSQPRSHRASRQTHSNGPQAPEQPISEADWQYTSGSRPGPLGNPKLTFQQFVIGASNRLAHAAALTVAEMPAQAYNPLFICGPPGVGKTHLLSSIATLMLAHNPALTVRCTTGESFTNEFLDSLSSGRAEDFKARFRHVDVLLLDDVQFLERKTKTEEEFFHTFNALHDSGRQIVLSSDRPPNDLQALEDRLRERFAAGLVADIRPPDLITRIAILRKRAHQDSVTVADPQTLTLIAERIDNNVRALEGALIRVVAYSSLTGRPLTPELAGEVLDTLYPRETLLAQPRIGSVSQIKSIVSDHFGLTPEELISTARVKRIAWPRQVAMYLARELTSESLPAIGRHFGGRDHTTVLHAHRRTSARLLDDDEAREAVEKLCAMLTPAGASPQQSTADRLA